jgi:cleavage stimulation factor subunit 1
LFTLKFCFTLVHECFSQLFYDGHQSLAVGLSAVAQADPPCPPSDRLLHVVMAGLQHEPERPQKTGAAALTIPGQETLTATGLGKNMSTHSIIFNDGT